MERAERNIYRLTGARAYRTYLGGRLLDAFHGKTEGEDGHFPEEWIASLVSARNAGREALEEGLSMLVDNPELSLRTLIQRDPIRCLGAAHVEKFGANPGILVKLIDAAERLTVQVHPDKEMARKLFHSEYGKTECWHILGGRETEGEKPGIYLGFREGVTRKQWQELFQRQDSAGMLSCLHRFTVQAGDTILIEGGVPHAIGAGNLLLEIQEPTDYTIRVEQTTPSGLVIDEGMCHQGLGFERMFDCFHYQPLSALETRGRWFLTGTVEQGCQGSGITELIGYADTPCFAMKSLEMTGQTVTQETVSSTVVILEGSGSLQSGGRMIPVKKGEQLFITAGAAPLIWTADASAKLRLIQCFGPQPD